jgi:hypothetical protein
MDSSARSEYGSGEIMKQVSLLLVTFSAGLSLVSVEPVEDGGSPNVVSTGIEER